MELEASFHRCGALQALLAFNSCLYANKRPVSLAASDDEYFFSHARLNFDECMRIVYELLPPADVFTSVYLTSDTCHLGRILRPQLRTDPARMPFRRTC